MEFASRRWSLASGIELPSFQSPSLVCGPRSGGIKWVSFDITLTGIVYGKGAKGTVSEIESIPSRLS